MGDKTGIEWTEATWNPIRGCSRVSEGCRNCYAEGIAARFSHAGEAYFGLAELKRVVDVGDPTKFRNEPRWTGKVVFVPEHLEDPLRWTRPRKIFVNSMSDLFHDGVTDQNLFAILAVMCGARHHTYQVLTKRPERMLKFLSQNIVADKMRLLGQWPAPHILWGVSAEDQETANKRIPLVLTLAQQGWKTWVSYEPALGPIDFRKIDYGWRIREVLDKFKDGTVRPENGVAFLDSLKGTWNDGWDIGNDGGKLVWVVCGGESGSGARNFDVSWARSVRDQCREAGVAFFMKQLGTKPIFNRVEPEARISLRGKNDDPAHWPADLRIMEYPQ